MDLRELRELIEFMKAEEITELEVERADVKVRLKRGVHHGPPASPPSPFAVHPASPVSTPPPRVPSASGLVTLTSPIVGVFYRAPSPDAESYIEVGQPVKKGQILCVIEAMKLMNEIEAEADGRVIEILVENAHSVEYGQPLFLIEPAAEPHV